MGEYPCTRLDKAALKFRLQGGKKSKNVTGLIAEFFPILFGNFCRISLVRATFHAFFHITLRQHPAQDGEYFLSRIVLTAGFDSADCVMSIFSEFIFDF
jgi:hypothetical protein